MFYSNSFIFRISIYIKKSLEDVNRNVIEDNARLTSYLVESIEGIETVKAFMVKEMLIKLNYYKNLT